MDYSGDKKLKKMKNLKLKSPTYVVYHTKFGWVHDINVGDIHINQHSASLHVA